ncbi:hypothetical protein [Rhizobium sp. BK251]|nr:hypothetical protein [Rhizobium sp. BK251]TCL73683.1 hypothetical protein EV286_103215 [Rhizobium sp. BK251]
MSKSLISAVGAALLVVLALTSCTLDGRRPINGGDGNYFYGPNRH